MDAVKDEILVARKRVKTEMEIDEEEDISFKKYTFK